MIVVANLSMASFLKVFIPSFNLSEPLYSLEIPLDTVPVALSSCFVPANKDLVPAANCLTPLRNTELFFVNFLLFVVIVDEFFTIAAAPLFNFLLFAVSVLPPFESFVILVLI